jgi:signal transduction histidine kinase
MKTFFSILRRWGPQRLTGQMIGLLLGALVIAQIANFVIFTDERRAAIRLVERTQILERTASLIHLIEHGPQDLHHQMVQAASSRKLYYWLSETSPIPDGLPDGANQWVRRLQELLGEGKVRQLRSATPQKAGSFPSIPLSDVDKPGLLFSARLEDGRWLNVGMGIMPPLTSWALPTLLSMVFTAASICIIVLLMVQRITRPLGKLAEVAELIGRGDSITPIPEEGPADIRQTIRAFNRMYERLQRFVQDRTRMLAAISHDLRTPITCLRLQAELIEDREARGKILETLDEMQRMTEATLTFSRDEASTEVSRTVDLNALIDSLCQDLAEMGMDVKFEGGKKIPYPCRPTSLKRAIRNLIENAVTYGGRARVMLQPSDGEFRILIQDDGPGIPEQDRERVFQPFVRLEESRSKQTGGNGLGMAIARSIVRKHGGDIHLDSVNDRGLTVTIVLPEAPQEVHHPQLEGTQPLASGS